MGTSRNGKPSVGTRYKWFVMHRGRAQVKAERQLRHRSHVSGVRTMLEECKGKGRALWRKVWP